MHKKPTNYIVIFLLITFIGSSVTLKGQKPVAGDTNTAISITHATGFKTTALKLGGALGYGVFRDAGTAPFRFTGIGLMPRFGIEWGGMRDWITTLDFNSYAGVFEDSPEPRFNFGAFDISNTFRLHTRKAVVWLYRVTRITEETIDGPYSSTHKSNYATISFGTGITNFLDVTVNPDYDNATAGVSEFAGAEVALRFELDPDALCSARWLAMQTLHAEVGIMPVAAVLRPGYAYIDNYTSSQPVSSALFNEFTWSVRPFAGIYTSIGTDIFTEAGGKIAVSYVWNYHTTGNSGAWRFDHSYHLIAIDLYFNIKSKLKCEASVRPL